MNKTYIHVSITHYTTKGLAPDVHYYYNNGVLPPISSWDMSPEEANILMWKLIKMGGKNSYKSNPYSNRISTREVVFWGELDQK